MSTVVARMALGAWTHDALVPYLAPSERARFASLPHARRRHEYAAGRVLAKYLFLSRSHDNRHHEERQRRGISPFVVRNGEIPRFARDDMQVFSASEYREIEIVRDDGPPLFLGHPNVHLSIAHGLGCAVAAISTHGPIGVDITDVAHRVPSFYRAQFSPRERAWANGEASYALLWALKESVVKTGAVPDATLWGFDEIEILVEEPAAEVVQHLSDTIIPLTVRVPRAASAIAGAGFARVSDLFLSFVTLEPSAA